jgi:hypothetical protein
MAGSTIFCNSALGRELGLTKLGCALFGSLDREEPISDFEVELLVRRMWKFEGLQRSLYAAESQRYTSACSLVDRITKPRAFADLRRELLLAITPPGDDAFTMSGVFRQITKKLPEKLYVAGGISRWYQTHRQMVRLIHI